MFGNKQIKILEEKLEESARMLMMKAKQLKDTEEAYRKKLECIYSTDVASSDFEFDFKSKQPFSIGRIQKNNNPPTTIIAWVEPDGKNVEWVYHCSLEQHQKLAEQFRKYKGK